MSSRLPFANHSFRLMLYLEWILLGILLLGVVRPTPMPGLRLGINPGGGHLLGLPILIGFGLLGLWLPQGSRWGKVLYVAAEFALLVLALSLDRRSLSFPLMGLIVVMRSCLMFQQPGRLLVTGGVFVLFLLQLFEPMPPLPPPRGGFSHGPPPDFAATLWTLKLNTAITFGLTLLFTLLLINALLSERQSREQLLRANAQLRRYALRIEDQATLQERNRIAREIHDALGHTLTAQSIQLENAQLFLPAEAEKTAAFLGEAKQLGARALQEVRRSISTLRADPLRGQALGDAIATAIAEFRQTSGITPELTLELTQSLPGEINVAIYRVLQESLTNIYRHSQATEVRIALQQRLGVVVLEVYDNGQGFDPERNTTGFGLQGMRERAAALGGQFVLSSQPDQGCQVRLTLPLPSVAL